MLADPFFLYLRQTVLDHFIIFLFLEKMHKWTVFEKKIHNLLMAILTITNNDKAQDPSQNTLFLSYIIDQELFKYVDEIIQILIGNI